MNEYHVSPIGDLIEHEIGGDECPCGPDVHYHDEDGSPLNEPVVVHHSLDGRELHESDR